MPTGTCTKGNGSLISRMEPVVIKASTGLSTRVSTKMGWRMESVLRAGLTIVSTRDSM